MVMLSCELQCFETLNAFPYINGQSSPKSRRTRGVRKTASGVCFQVSTSAHEHTHTHTNLHTFALYLSAHILPVFCVMKLLLSQGWSLSGLVYTAPTLCHACGCLINI